VPGLEGRAVPGSGTALQDGTETIISAAIDAPIPFGQYTFIAVLVKQGMSIADSANWVSNAALASFAAPAPPGLSRSRASRRDLKDWAGTWP
jgi:hypothetical protein